MTISQDEPRERTENATAVSAKASAEPLKAEPAPKAQTDPWNQRGIYIRLSKHRKAALLHFAKSTENTDSPHQALAASIEYAATSTRSNDSRDQACAVNTRDDFDEDSFFIRLRHHQESLAQISQRLESRLEALNSNLQLATIQIGPLTSEHQNSATPIAAWLNSQGATTLRNVENMVLVRANWVGAFPGDNSGCVVVIFDVKLLNARATCPPSARVQILAKNENGSLLARIAPSPLQNYVIACKKSECDAAWLATFFPQGADGKLERVHRVDASGMIGETAFRSRSSQTVRWDRTLMPSLMDRQRCLGLLTFPPDAPKSSVQTTWRKP